MKSILEIWVAGLNPPGKKAARRGSRRVKGGEKQHSFKERAEMVKRAREKEEEKIAAPSPVREAVPEKEEPSIPFEEEKPAELPEEPSEKMTPEEEEPSLLHPTTLEEFRRRLEEEQKKTEIEEEERRKLKALEE